MRSSTKERLFIASTIAILLLVIYIGMLWNKVVSTRSYVYCQLIQPGMSKQEVTLALHSLGEYNEEGGPNHYYVGFKGDILTRVAVGHMALLFDNKGVLIGTAKEISLGDWGEGAECK